VKKMLRWSIFSQNRAEAMLQAASMQAKRSRRRVPDGPLIKKQLRLLFLL